MSMYNEEFVSNWLSLVYLPTTKSDVLYLIYAKGTGTILIRGDDYKPRC